MSADFRARYNKLNRQQKQAVNYIEGPLLVIAGPGTGKTQLLSLRAANILDKTDALPENILCLTFTEAGALEMRSRLISTIGQAAAYKITVSTYHGFANDIIGRNPEYFSGGPGLRSISRLKADIIIRDLQRSLPFTSTLKDPELVQSIAGLISDAKQALLSPADLSLVANANLDFIKKMNEITRPLSDSLRRVSISSTDTFSKLLTSTGTANLPKGIETLASIWNYELEQAIVDSHDARKTKSLTKWKAKYLAKDAKNHQIAKGADQNQRLVESSKLYDKYAKRLKSDGLYDYDDMIMMSIEALKKHDELRFNLQEKYLYIMLDEYQDTNLAQAELTMLLTNNPSSEGRPNIMALGDDDQAIYAFQGAKHSNMVDFTNRYRDVEKITLKSNYRSTQPIIDLSSQVASQINERLTTLLKGINKDFKAVRSGDGKIDNLKLVSEAAQYNWLAKDVAKASSKDIAILAPEHKYLERASAYLTEQNISLSYERSENILDDPLIAQLVTILRLLKAINEKNGKQIDWLLASVLNYDFWGLPIETIWQLSWHAHDHSEPWLKVMLSRPKTRIIALMLIKLASNALEYRYDFIIDQVIGLSDIVIGDTKTKSSRSSFLEFYSRPGDDLTSYRLFQNLMVIREQFKDFHLDNSRPLMIADLIDFIDQIKSSNIKLVNNFNYGSTNATVKLMTVHGSKGQEFDTVYLLSFINEVWGPKNRSRGGIGLPPNLEYIRHGAEDADDEKLRLLYVALSRTKNRLITLSYDQDTAAKNTTPLKYMPITPKSLKTAIELKPLWQLYEGPIEINTELQDLLKKRLESYSLSPTDLKTFTDIRHAGPQAFYKSVLLKYKTPVSARVDYGSAVHNTLQWLQQSLSTTGRLPPIKQLITEFEKLLLARRLTSEDFEHLKKQGIEALSVYYATKASSFSKDDLSEVNFRGEGVVIGQARLSGQIDKLIIDKPNKTITIVDYKTGKGQGSWTNTPKLHGYQNQLYFYKLLVEQSPSFRGYKVHGGILDFVEPDVKTGELHQLELNYDASETRRMVRLIAAVWQHIEDLNFPSVTGYSPDIRGILKFEEDLITGKI